MKVDHFLAPGSMDILRTAGLHRVIGEMTGAGALTAPKVAGLIGQRAFARRKTARLVARGLVALAQARGQAMSQPDVDRLRASIYPATQGRR